MVEFMFQSTLPHGERPHIAIPKRQQWQVSIHAPARGATSYGAGCKHGSYVSIHAPARGATTSEIDKLVESMFQSTLPHGERHWSPGLE